MWLLLIILPLASATREVDDDVMSKYNLGAASLNIEEDVEQMVPVLRPAAVLTRGAQHILPRAPPNWALQAECHASHQAQHFPPPVENAFSRISALFRGGEAWAARELGRGRSAVVYQFHEPGSGSMGKALDVLVKMMPLKKEVAEAVVGKDNIFQETDAKNKRAGSDPSKVAAKEVEVMEALTKHFKETGMDVSEWPVPKLLESEEDGDILAYAMTRVPGISLREAVLEGKGIPIMDGDTVSDTTYRVTTADMPKLSEAIRSSLEQVWNAGVANTDLNYGNILVSCSDSSADGKMEFGVKLIDYGFAVLSSQRGGAGCIRRQRATYTAANLAAQLSYDLMTE